VVDEAFMDAVPGEPESLLIDRPEGLLVLRSLTKHWSIPGIRAGFVVGDRAVVTALRRAQTPWSVSGPAIAAITACMTEEAQHESARRARQIVEWRRFLIDGLDARGRHYVRSAAPFVLTQLGSGAYERLREEGIAVRRCDTFPGLDDSWVRVAVRSGDRTRRLLNAIDGWVEE
jgi:cobyrinic acid a,c-diamide synthase